jgi:hypothetical protein
MDVKINESKFKKLLFNYLDNETEFKRAQEHRTGYGSNVREFFIESNYGDEDAPDYDWLFTYYKSSEDYEDIVGVNSPYESSEYPLIEYSTYYFKPIIEMFGSDKTINLILEWLNNYFGADAITLEGG